MARVLLVEDEPDIRTLARTVLESAGHEVTEAEDGEQALALLVDVPPDAMVLDLAMPRMDGFGLLKEVRSKQRLRSLPIVILSANVDAATENRAYELGCKYGIRKPFTGTQLLKTVERAILAPSPGQ